MFAIGFKSCCRENKFHNYYLFVRSTDFLAQTAYLAMVTLFYGNLFATLADILMALVLILLMDKNCVLVKCCWDFLTLPLCNHGKCHP